MKSKVRSKIAVGAMVFSLLPAGPIAYAQQPKPSDASINAYEQEIGFQRRVVLEETKALDEAYENRNNSVHIGEHLRDLLAYGISSGYLATRFFAKTDNMSSLRNYLMAKKGSTVASNEVVSMPAAEARASAAAAAEASSASRAALYRSIGSGIARTAEATGAVVLGLFFINDISDTGHDLYVRFSDTDEIRNHKTKLRVALANLDVADKNLQTAILNTPYEPEP